jgi:3-hydroxybutyryl-CoA dehydratase
MLIASFISSVIGNKFPGNGTIYVSQDLKFKRPVKINDIVKVKILVEKIISRKKWCQLKTVCFVKNKIVLEGTAVVVPPQKK